MREVLDTLSGCGFLRCQRIPGVRKKRVPLANFLAPLRGALARLRHARALLGGATNSLLDEFDDEWFAKSARHRAICHGDRCSSVSRAAANAVSDIRGVAEELNSLGFGGM